MKFEIMKFVNTHDTIHRGCDKKLNVFCTYCHVHCLQTQTSLKKFHEIKKEADKFIGKLTFKLEFEFKFLPPLNSWQGAAAGRGAGRQPS
jgi:hypothetical protein